MLIDAGEGAVWVPDPNPMVVLARGGSTAGLLPRLCEDLVFDVLVACTREQQEHPTRTGAHMLDVVRADLHRRHAPAEPQDVCRRCLCAWDEHDEVDQACPDDERFRAAA